MNIRDALLGFSMCENPSTFCQRIAVRKCPFDEPGNGKAKTKMERTSEDSDESSGLNLE